MKRKSSELPTSSIMTLGAFICTRKMTPFLVILCSKILLQRGHFRLTELLIIVDGEQPTIHDENLADLDDRIRIIHKEKRGLTDSVNYAMRTLTADIAIKIDDDVVELSDTLFAEMASLYSDDRTGVVGVEYRRVADTSILSRVDAWGWQIWSNTKKRAGTRGLTYHIVGSCRAMRKDIYADLVIPTVEEDTYTTLYALHKGWKIAVTPTAFITTREHIDSLRNLVLRYSRHLSSSYRAYFPKKWLATQRPSLLLDLFHSIFKAFFKKPFLTTLYVLLIGSACVIAYCNKHVITRY